MKITVTFLLLILSVSVYSQSNIAIGLISSADITGLSQTPEGKKNGIALYDEPRFGYQGGVRLKYGFAKVFSVQTGLSLVSHQVGSGAVALKPLDQNDPDIPDSYESINTFKNFQIPLLFSFYTGRKLRFGVTAGAAYNHIYRVDEESTAYYKTHSQEFRNTQKLTSQNQYLSVIAGVGVEYAFEHFIIRAEPMGSYQLYFFDNDYANDNYRLWSVGLGLSTFYQF